MHQVVITLIECKIFFVWGLDLNSPTIVTWAIKLFVLFLPFLFLYQGSQDLYTFFVYSNPRKMDCQDFLKQSVDGRWYALRNCDFDMSNHVKTKDADGNVTEFYVPVRSRNKASNLVVSFGEESLQKITRLEKKGKNPRTKQHKRLLGKNIEGVLQYGLLKESSFRNFGFDQSKLTADYVIIEEGKRPSLWLSLQMIAGGIVLLMIWYEIRKLWRAADTETQQNPNST